VTLVLVYEMKSKKGATPEGTAVGLVIAITLLVVVVVAIIYVSTRTSEVAANIPERVEAIIVACGADISTHFYCNQLREIGKDKYVTCDYAAKYENLVTIKEWETRNLECGGDVDVARIKIFKAACLTGDYADNTDAILNGVSCEDRMKDITTKEGALAAAKLKETADAKEEAEHATCDAAGGAFHTPVPPAVDCPEDQSVIDRSEFKEDLPTGKLCCELA